VSAATARVKPAEGGVRAWHTHTQYTQLENNGGTNLFGGTTTHAGKIGLVKSQSNYAVHGGGAQRDKKKRQRIDVEKEKQQRRAVVQSNRL
jgi:hypothetical protein